jgi:GMP synthase-like glutamine amidotransferase
LQHVSFETPGLLADEIRERGAVLRTTAVYAGEPLPAMEDFDVLIVMGGPMSVHDEAEYPWLRAEKELIAAAIREGKKVLGICLGAQLIAAVCGARVYKNPVKEIGWWPVRWENVGVEEVERSGREEEASEEKVGIKGLDGKGEGRVEEVETIAFHWHGETLDLPEGAELLASTPGCVNQAFRLGDRVLGIQFHPEVTGEIIRGMVEHEGWELVDGPYIQSREEILAGVKGMVVGGRWMALLREWL